MNFLNFFLKQLIPTVQVIFCLGNMFRKEYGIQAGLAQAVSISKFVRLLVLANIQ